MLSNLKKSLYFPIASYFSFFAKIRLKRWNPRIIVVTGSNGKTTLLHMLESQIGDKAKYSHHANSSFGIPFDILNLHRKTLLKSEWIRLFLYAPLQVFTPLPKEKLYVVEADADRPLEGKFLAEMLYPEVVLWVSTSKTHSMNFDASVAKGIFKSVEEAIAYEYGYFLAYAKKYCIVDGDSELEMRQIKRTNAEIKEIHKSSLTRYKVGKEGTTFEIDKTLIEFTSLLPKEIYLSVAMCKALLNYLDLPFDRSFKSFVLPPGRGSLFSGIKNISIIDSCYNANLSSMQAILDMYHHYPAGHKWAVLGDMLEQGKQEKSEHEKLAEEIAKLDLERIILLGPRVKKYIFPHLRTGVDKKIPIDVFENPKEVYEFIEEKLQGGETILFKGARFMEAIIEKLLLDKKDSAKLTRREKIWDIRRKQWGF